MNAEHDVLSCTNCTVQEVSVNGHEMQMLLPCNEPVAYWTCLTCDAFTGWPVTDDIDAINEIMNAMLWIHCIDNLLYQ